MATGSNSLSRRLSVIWAITSKDLLDALKNKTTLAVLLPALFILIFYRFLPQIYGHDDLITVHLFDPTHSEAAMLLEESLDLDVRSVDSLVELKQSVANSDVAELGIALPEDFELQVHTPLMLETYMIYWLPEATRLETADAAERELSFLLDRDIELQLHGNTVYPSIDSEGLGFLASISIVFALVMIGIAFLPNLMLEEHKEQTMQLLHVSPATDADIVTAKAITGLFYALMLSILSWILYWRLFLNPFITAGTFIVGSLLFILAGLLLGTLVKTRQQLMMVAWVIIIPLLLPPFFEMMDEILPSRVLRIIRSIPSVALARMLRTGMNPNPDWGFYVTQLLYLLAIVALLFALTVLLLKRRDRR